MIVKALDKEWEVSSINTKQQEDIYAEFVSNYPEVEGSDFIREQTPAEKKCMTNLYFRCFKLGNVTDPPNSLTEKMALGMAIMSNYLGFDKKKLSEQESEDG